MPLRVLIVDDNRDAADCLGLLLGLLGATSQVCYGGADALAHAPEFRPHVGLLDIDMPGMSGLELARRLRVLLGRRRVMLVAVTGVSSEEARAATAAAGFDWHLTKPVDGTTLAGRLLAFHRTTFPADG
ncbi:MAG TPA: response regulator [Urbifossiella sp.]|nr:response regulator [Urbifossiella sp.]